MKATKVGRVIIEANAIRVEDWLVEREENDPKNIPEENLLAKFASEWALGRLMAAVEESIKANAESLAKKFFETAAKQAKN